MSIYNTDGGGVIPNSTQGLGVCQPATSDHGRKTFYQREDGTGTNAKTTIKANIQKHELATLTTVIYKSVMVASSRSRSLRGGSNNKKKKTAVLSYVAKLDRPPLAVTHVQQHPGITTITITTTALPTAAVVTLDPDEVTLHHLHPPGGVHQHDRRRSRAVSLSSRRLPAQPRNTRSEPSRRRPQKI